MIEAPFFLFEGHSLSIFETVENIERYVEAIDIKNNEYQIFDKKGYLLVFKVVSEWKKFKCMWIFPLKIKVENVRFSHYEPVYQEDFKKKVKEIYDMYINDQCKPSHLDDMVNQLILHCGFTE